MAKFIVCTEMQKGCVANKMRTVLKGIWQTKIKPEELMVVKRDQMYIYGADEN